MNHAVILGRLPGRKLREYEEYPLAHRIGFMHVISEDELDIGSATITDVGFLGLFPKKILECLKQYAEEVGRANQDKEEYMKCVTNLITAFVYRPLAIQKVIQIMTTEKKKSILNAIPKNITTDPDADDATQYAPSINNTSTTANTHTLSNYQNTLREVPPICYGNKCRILKAKGILRRPMFCANRRNMCAGCIHEAGRHRKVQQIEHQILHNTASNDVWVPLLNWICTPITLVQLRRLLKHLPIYNTAKRDDHIYGATRYIANSLGIQLSATNMSELVDQQMTNVEKKQAWRTATFQCRCPNQGEGTYHNCGVRTFCKKCCLLIPNDSMITDNNQCRFCHLHEFWKFPNHPCLSCQFATMIFRNPFHWRLHQNLQQLLEIEESDDNMSFLQTPIRVTSPVNNISERDMLQQRNQSFEQTYQEVRSRSTQTQSKYIFENLSILQRNIQNNLGSSKRNHYTQDQSNENMSRSDSIISPKKLNYAQGNSNKVTSITSGVNNSFHNPRIPLRNLDLNSEIMENTGNNSYNKGIRSLKKQERTRRAKEKRNRKNNAPGQE